MAILAPAKGKPDWLDEARAFCRDRKINIAAWGPDLLTVESGSPERDREIASQFAQIGFHVVENPENGEAGLLDLSRNPEAIRNAIASFDISHRRWGEQIEPLIWAAASAVFLASLSSHSVRYHAWLSFALGVLLALIFVWDALRIWTWRLELLPDAVRVRRYGRWSSIPWKQIRAVESRPARIAGLPGLRQRGMVSVILKLESHSTEPLGTFVDAFGINLRDRLRFELAQRRHEHS
jgi:hypothetical protein